MIIIVLTMLLVLLVPLWPLLLIRREPVRPAAPVSEGELHRLAAQLRPGEPPPPDELDEIVREARRLQRHPGEPPPPKAPAAAGADDPTGRLSLKKRYQWINVAMLPVVLGLMFGMAAVWAVALHLLGEARAWLLPRSAFVLTPMYWVPFLLPSFFLGICTSAVIHNALLKLLLGRRYAEYSHWEQARFGADSPEGRRRYTKLWTFLALLIGVPTAALVPLVMNWYTRFTDQEVAVRRFASLGETVYPYGRVRELVVSTHGETAEGEVFPRKDLLIRFDDAQTWTAGGLFRVTPEETERLLAFLRAKTGKPVRQVRFLREVTNP